MPQERCDLEQSPAERETLSYIHKRTTRDFREVSEKKQQQL